MSTISQSCPDLNERRIPAMVSIIAFIIFVTVLALAAFDSISDMRPQRRPPQWSVGRLIERRR